MPPPARGLALLLLLLFVNAQTPFGRDACNVSVFSGSPTNVGGTGSTSAA